MKIRKFEIVLIAALLVACAAWGFYLYRPRGGDTIAVITADSQEVRRIDLAHAKDEVFTLMKKILNEAIWYMAEEQSEEGDSQEGKSDYDD